MEKGFEVIPLFSDEKKSREMQFSFPLGRLRRIKDDGSFELIEIQLEKYGAAKFRINFGVIPPEGINHPVKHVKQQDADIGFLPYSGELYRCPFFMLWFSISNRFSSKSPEIKINELVDKVIGYIPEVEEWFKTGKIGRYFAFPGQTNS